MANPEHRNHSQESTRTDHTETSAAPGVVSAQERADIAMRNAERAMARATEDMERVQAIRRQLGLNTPKPKGRALRTFADERSSPVLAAKNLIALSSEEALAKLPKKAGFFGSRILTGIENWGKKMVEKNASWMKKIPLLGWLATGDVKKTWEEREKAAEKKAGEAAKWLSEQKKKGAEAIEKARSSAEQEMRKAASDHERKVRAEDRLLANRTKELTSLMTPDERVAFKDGSDADKDAIIARVEAEEDTRRALKKMDERDRAKAKRRPRRDRSGV